MARPKFRPTPEQRRKVAVAAGGGMAHEEIALALGISRNTLEKHFEVELSVGAAEKRAEVLDAMHKAAVNGNVTAQKAYMALEPQVAAPPTEELGKKERAKEAARTAQEGTEWHDLLPRPSTVQ